MQAKVSENKDATRDFVDAADVRGPYLLRKDGFMLMYLRIYPYNLELMSQIERQGKTDNLAATFKSDRKDFDYFSLPREVDMDKYKQNLKERYRQEGNIGRRHLLNIMMGQAANITMSGENYEHQHFIKIWQLANKENRKNVEQALGERMREFESRYRGIGVECELLQESDIIKLCNLFGNNLQASYEVADDNVMFSAIPFMKSV